MTDKKTIDRVTDLLTRIGGAHVTVFPMHRRKEKGHRQSWHILVTSREANRIVCRTLAPYLWTKRTECLLMYWMLTVHKHEKRWVLTEEDRLVASYGKGLKRGLFVEEAEEFLRMKIESDLRSDVERLSVPETLVVRECQG